MSAAATAAGYLYASGRMRGRASGKPTHREDNDARNFQAQQKAAPNLAMADAMKRAASSAAAQLGYCSRCGSDNVDGDYCNKCGRLTPLDGAQDQEQNAPVIRYKKSKLPQK